jgi:hypothetical protein
MTPIKTDRSATERRVWIGFAVLCVAAGSRWVAATYLPSELPPLVEQSLHEAVIAAGAGIVAWRGGLRACWGCALYGVLLLALPSVVSSLAAGAVSSMAGMAMLTLVPAAAAMIAAQRADGFGAVEGGRGLLLPALAGAGGALLLLPLAVPPSVAGKLWLAGLALCGIGVAWACVRLHSLLRGVGIWSGVAMVFGASAVVAACFGRGWAMPWDWSMAVRELGFCVLIDAPLAALTVWLLRELEPVRFAVRYLVVPLVSILEGMALVRQRLDWTTAAGLALMAAGSVALLVQGGEQPGSELKLR